MKIYDVTIVLTGEGAKHTRNVWVSPWISYHILECTIRLKH